MAKKNHLSMSIAECHCKSFCCYVPSVNIVCGFNHLCYLVSGSCHPSSTGMGSISWSGPSSNQISVAYSHKICAILALVYLAGRTLLKIKGFVAGLVIVSPLKVYGAPFMAKNTR